VKLAAARSQCKLVTVPSSPATCACATRVAVLYAATGEFNEVIDLERGPELCLLDEDLLSSAPRIHRAAGLADTLAKHLEAEVASPEPVYGLGTGRALGALAYAQCLEHGSTWLKSEDPSSPESRAALEAVVMSSALASCFGQVPAAAAHSLANGLSLVPIMRSWLHGELVGLGLLWQDRVLEALGRPLPGAAASLQEREDLLKDWGLRIRAPRELLALGPAVVAKSLAPEESIHAIPGLGDLGPQRLLTLLEGLVTP